MVNNISKYFFVLDCSTGETIRREVKEVDPEFSITKNGIKVYDNGDTLSVTIYSDKPIEKNMEFRLKFVLMPKIVKLLARI